MTDPRQREIKVGPNTYRSIGTGTADEPLGRWRAYYRLLGRKHTKRFRGIVTPEEVERFHEEQRVVDQHLRARAEATVARGNGDQAGEMLRTLNAILHELQVNRGGAPTIRRTPRRSKPERRSRNAAPAQHAQHAERDRPEAIATGPQAVGAFMKDCRQKKGLTIEQAAARLHVSVSALSLIEREKRRPRPATLSTCVLVLTEWGFPVTYEQLVEMARNTPKKGLSQKLSTTVKT
jgi:DNA-binding transcriptional regulator YiaG